MGFSMKLRSRALSAASAMLIAAFAATAMAQDKKVELVVTSPTLKQGERVPVQHTPDGRNDSPALNWVGAPVTTKSFVVFCEDPDVGNPPPFVHWVVYNIPGTMKGLPAALPIDGTMPPQLAGAAQGLSGFRRALYRGPAPPPGKPHYYHFVVYALDSLIATSPDQPPPTRAQLLEFMKGHVLAQGELVATYERK
jgi:Raf kinase inhibitor-like YbhB/YbcL family protein